MKIGYKNILLTGEPGCGKSTLLKNLIATVEHKVGFLTEQVLDQYGNREGFELVNHQGNRHILASKKSQSSILYADKYYIHQHGLQNTIASFDYSSGDLIYVDEIAPMQLYVPGFEEFISSLLNLKNPILGVIKLNDDSYPFIQEIKQRDDTLIINLSDGDNHHEFLQGLIKKIIKSQNYILDSYRYHKISNQHYNMTSSSHLRKITIDDRGIIQCNCDFYTTYGICSHTIALRQII